MVFKKLTVFCTFLCLGMSAYTQVGKNLPKIIRKASFKKSAATLTAQPNRLAVQNQLSARTLHSTQPNAPVTQPRKYKTPQAHLADLEDFVTKQGYFPSIFIPAERRLYMNVYHATKQLDPQDPIVLRVEQLKKQNRQKQREQAIKTYLNDLEDFIATHGYFPGTDNPVACSLYMNIRNILKQLPPHDPLVLRIQKLRAQTRVHPLRTPYNWLTELENFLQKNNRYPALGISKLENQLYFELEHLVKTLGPDDPIVRNINQLRTAYIK